MSGFFSEGSLSEEFQGAQYVCMILYVHYQAILHNESNENKSK